MDLSQLGEFGLIELLTRDLPRESGVIKGVGDDTAVLAVSGDNWLLYTTDMMVEGMHFSRDYSELEEIGWKLIAINVSDIAAMGGRPTHAVISVAIPQYIRATDMMALYRGIKEAAQAYRVSVVGGDTVRTIDRMVLNATMLGEVQAGGAVYRHGAKPGDEIFVSGALGASAAGLQLFRNPEILCSEPTADYCRLAYTKPRPNVEAGVLLAVLGVSAMNDISDGLASEIHEICSASGVGCLLREADIPIDPRVIEVGLASGVPASQWALYGGEDFHLVFTAPAQARERIQEAALLTGLTVYRVGEIRAGGEILLELSQGEVGPLPKKGYDHFANHKSKFTNYR